MINIFEKTAPLYWEAGLPVIPLITGEKRPIPTDWTRFCTSMPDEATQAKWLKNYAEGNIGLPLGPESGVVCIDIDTDDEALIAEMVATLPHSPWKRVGKKGMVLAYKYEGQKTFQIRDQNGQTLVELLSTKRQVVLPPSIHPDTQRPYTANGDLFEVAASLPSLGSEVEALLRGLIEDYGIELSSTGHSKILDWVPAGSRDVTMIEHAGMYALSVRRGECSLKQAIGSIRAWHDGRVEQVAGDELDIDKGVMKIVEFLRKDVIEKEKLLPKGWDEGLTDEEKEKMGLNFDEDMIDWDVEQLREYLVEQFSKYNRHEYVKRGEAVRTVMKRMAASPAMESLEQEAILAFIRDTSGGNYTLSSLRKQLNEHKSAERIDGTDHTQIAEALLEEYQRSSEIRFHAEDFYIWRGAHWSRLDPKELRRKIATEFGDLPMARRAADHKGILDVLATLCSKPLQKVNDVAGINFANGIYTENGTLVKHDKDYGFTYVLPYRYIPDAARGIDRFRRFMEDSWGPDDDYDDKVSALQEAICITLFGLAAKYQRAFLLYGAPACGKSVLLDVISDLLPEEGKCSIPPDSWSDTFLPAEMFGKIVNICGELSETRKIDGVKFKEIVANGKITAQRKNRDPFQFRAKCAHWFGSNHLPQTRDTSEGFTRRWLTFEFKHPVPKDKMDRSLALKIITEEREAIVAWALQALTRIKSKGDYTLPKSHVEIMGDVAVNNNSVRFFIQESGKVTVDPENVSTRISTKILYDAYSFFCIQEGAAKRVSRADFKGMMRELASTMGVKRELAPTETGGRDVFYYGLTLADGTA